MRHRAALLLLVPTLLLVHPTPASADEPDDHVVPPEELADDDLLAADGSVAFSVHRVDVGPAGFDVVTATGWVDPVSRLVESRVERRGEHRFDLVLDGADAYGRLAGATLWYRFTSSSPVAVVPFPGLGADVDPRQVLLGIEYAAAATAGADLAAGVRTDVDGLRRVADALDVRAADRIVATHLGPAADDAEGGVVVTRVTGEAETGRATLVVVATGGGALSLTRMRLEPAAPHVVQRPDGAVRVLCGCGG